MKRESHLNLPSKNMNRFKSTCLSDSSSTCETPTPSLGDAVYFEHDDSDAVFALEPSDKDFEQKIEKKVQNEQLSLKHVLIQNM
jgi:hypothetical protein